MVEKEYSCLPGKMKMHSLTLAFPFMAYLAISPANRSCVSGWGPDCCDFL